MEIKVEIEINEHVNNNIGYIKNSFSLLKTEIDIDVVLIKNDFKSSSNLEHIIVIVLKLAITLVLSYILSPLH